MTVPGTNPPSPSEVRLRGNRLATARSAYLRQHAHNPVDWHTWGPEAFALARRQDKPVFLSIGYASCHWCHVMEAEVFDQDDVAGALNADFISIKVDREERPDVDAVYMAAVQTLTGSGGWPLSVFLTPDLKPFFGGAYFPREQFLRILAEIVRLNAEQRSAIEEQASRLADLAEPRAVSRGAIPGEPAIDDTAQSILRSCDHAWGGLTGRMKFPMPTLWTFLLRRYRKTGQPHLATALLRTLDAMATGGIRDHVGGGFHRYTVEPTWTVPHFEKMLYDNAQLASLYTEAALALNAPAYAEVAEDTLDFLLREMRDSGGGFYASFDADSPEGEGAYYVWGRAELVDAIGGEDGQIVAALYGVTDRGNFEGKNILTRRAPINDVARRFGRDEAEVRAIMSRCRGCLADHRATREAPRLDRKIVAAWNGHAIAAFARAFRAFGQSAYRDAAEIAAGSLWRAHRRADGTLLRASNDGIAEHPGVLDDYGGLAHGLLELHQATGDAQHLDRAVLLIDAAIERFARPEGAFYHTEDMSTSAVARLVPVFDGAEPSGNGVMLHCLLRAGALTGREDLLDRARDALSAYGALVGGVGHEMTAWLDAAQLATGPAYTVEIEGDPEGEDTARLARVARGGLYPHVTVGVRPGAGTAKARVCSHGACLVAVEDAGLLRERILEGWRY